MRNSHCLLILSFILFPSVVNCQPEQISPMSCNPRTIAFDTNSSSIYYVGTDGDGVYKTVDSGKNWSRINNGLESKIILCMDIDPRNNYLYIGTLRKGAYRSIDGGIKWESINSGITSEHIWSIKVDPYHQNTIYAGTQYGVFLSSSNGSTWSPVNKGMEELDIVTLEITNNRVYAGAQSGTGNTDVAFFSEDNGNTWESIASGMTNNYGISSIKVDPNNQQNIYMGTDGEGLLISNDGAKNWHFAEKNSNNSILNMIIDNNELIAVTPTRIMSLSNDGKDIREITNKEISNKYFKCITTNNSTKDTILIGCWGAIFRITKNRTLWENISNGILSTLSIPPLGILLNSKEPQTIFCTTFGGGVYKTIDFGKNWEQIINGILHPALQGGYVDPWTRYIYVGSDGGGIYRTMDNGKNWQEVNKGLTNLYINSITGSASGVLFASTMGGGVFKSYHCCPVKHEANPQTANFQIVHYNKRQAV